MRFALISLLLAALVECGTLQGAGLASLQWQTPENAYDDLPYPQLVKLLQSICSVRGRMNVPPEDGRCLYDLILNNGLTAGLEIGTSNGCSAIWAAMAFRQTRGRLITIEYNRQRGEEAEANFKKGRLEKQVVLRREDAFEVIPELSGPFDYVFIDAWKQDYNKYLKMVLPKVRPGGYIVAHNVVDQRWAMQDFIRSITENPQLETEFITVSSSGLSVTKKK